MKDYYQILEINPKASQEIIEKVFKIQIKLHHPDSKIDKYEKIKAEEKTKELIEAYDTLSNIEKRKNYDIELESYNKNLNNDNLINVISTLKNENHFLKENIKIKENMIEILTNQMQIPMVNTQNDILRNEQTDNLNDIPLNISIKNFLKLDILPFIIRNLIIIGIIIITILLFKYYFIPTILHNL